MQEGKFFGWASGAFVAIGIGLTLWWWGASVSQVDGLTWGTASATGALKSPLAP